MKKIKKMLLVTALLCVANNKSLKIQEDAISCFNMSDTTQIIEVSRENTQIDLNLSAKSAYLMDFCSNTVVYAENEDERLPIASMCKIMTLILCFDAIETGNITMDEEITISERAAAMGGSQVFLEAHSAYKIRELIKSIIVCSANDSCVAMAERIAGSEEIFVQKMNEKAKELNATNTLFANCTGLPKEPQYSCAKDVAIMLKKLLSYEEYYQFGKVWMDKFQHPNDRYTEITNTNKLIRYYEGCDGGKTGFTNEAGFCLAATAKRNDMRVIAVVIGEENSKTRFQDVSTMFDYTFANYQNIPIVEASKPLEEKIDVERGKTETLTVYPARSSYLFSLRGEKSEVVTELHFKKLQAPILKDEEVGQIVVFKNGIEVDRIPLLSADNVGRASFIDWIKKIAEEWNK